jgi:hypothetical protein
MRVVSLTGGPLGRPASRGRRSFERRDLLADRRLRVAESLRSPAEGALVRDRVKCDQMPQLDPQPTITLHDQSQW